MVDHWSLIPKIRVLFPAWIFFFLLVLGLVSNVIIPYLKFNDFEHNFIAEN